MTKNDSISSWQTAILIFILFFANKILILPSLLYEQAGIWSFIAMIVSFVLEFGLLFLFFRLKKKFPTETFSQILSVSFGKFWKNFVLIFVMVFFLGKSILLYNIGYIFFTNTVYKDASNMIFLVSFLPVVVYLCHAGIKVLGRTAQLFFPIVFVIVVFCLIVGVAGIDSVPILSDLNFLSLSGAWLKHLTAFGDTIFLFLIIDKIKIKKGQWKIVFSLALISAFLVTAITVIFVFSFTYTSYMHPFALFEIMSYVQEFGGVGRIDLISMVVIILLTYFHLAIYLYGFTHCFKDVFKINTIYSYVSFFAFFLLMINYLILNLEKAISLAKGFGQLLLLFLLSLFRFL